MIYIIIFFVIIISIIAITSFKYSNSKLKVIKQEAKKIAGFIEKLDSKNEKNLVAINEFIGKDFLLQEDWDNYYKQVAGEVDFKKILDPSYYLSPQKILNKYSRRSIANSIPGILTGVGILGTFLGLVIGLESLNLDLLEAVELRGQVSELIGGMQVSFVSSLAAIFCSVIWSGLDKWMFDNAEQELSKLNDKLHKALPIRIESNLLDEIVSNQREQIKTTKEFVSDTLIPELVNGLQEAVDRSIAPSIKKMDNNIEDFIEDSAQSRENLVKGIESVVGEQIAPQISDMHQIMEQMSNLSMDKQAENINKMVEKFMDTFNDAFDHQFDSLKETLEEVIIWQKKTKEETEKLIDTVSQGAQRQNELLDSTENLLGNVRIYVDEFDTLNGNLNQNVTKLNELGVQLASLEEKTNQRLENLLTSQEEFEELKNEHIKNMGAQLEEINDFWSSIRDNFSSLNNNLNNAMEQFADNTYQGLERTFQSFDDNLANIANRLGVTINELNEMLEELPNSFFRLTELLQEFSLDREEVLSGLNDHKEIIREEFQVLNSDLKVTKEEIRDEFKKSLYNKLESEFSKFNIDDNLDELEVELEDVKKKVNNYSDKLINKIDQSRSANDKRLKQLLAESKREIISEIVDKFEERWDEEDKGFFSKLRG